jgi:hypothetical protein
MNMIFEVFTAVKMSMLLFCLTASPHDVTTQRNNIGKLVNVSVK